jgi:hypothetical protein
VRNILLNWQMGDFFGWGILGFNVFAQWVNEPDIRPLMARQIRQQDLVMVDPLRMSHLRAAIIESNTRIAEFASSAPNGKIDGLVIDAVDNSLLGNSLSDGLFHGQINIGRCIFENADLADAREKLARYDHSITHKSA